MLLLYLSSGKTEYQTTKANKARRSASFERRPSRRYSRRTMQNRGERSQCLEALHKENITLIQLSTQQKQVLVFSVIAPYIYFFLFYFLQDHLIPMSKCIFIICSLISESTLSLSSNKPHMCGLSVI